MLWSLLQPGHSGPGIKGGMILLTIIPNGTSWKNFYFCFLTLFSAGLGILVPQWVRSTIDSDHDKDIWILYSGGKKILSEVQEIL